jgi:hypothetical protein
MSFGLPSFWNNPHKSSNTTFKCTANFSTGWKDETSFQVSTTNNTNRTSSSIHAREIDVKPRSQYQR